MSVLFLLFATACVLTNAIDVTSAVHKSAKGTPFDLHGMISPYVPNHSCFLITDASGSTRIEYKGSANTEQLQNGTQTGENAEKPVKKGNMLIGQDGNILGEEIIELKRLPI